MIRYFKNKLLHMRMIQEYVNRQSIALIIALKEKNRLDKEELGKEIERLQIKEKSIPFYKPLRKIILKETIQNLTEVYSNDKRWS